MPFIDTSPRNDPRFGTDNIDSRLEREAGRNLTAAAKLFKRYSGSSSEIEKHLKPGTTLLLGSKSLCLCLSYDREQQQGEFIYRTIEVRVQRINEDPKRLIAQSRELLVPQHYEPENQYNPWMKRRPFLRDQLSKKPVYADGIVLKNTEILTELLPYSPPGKIDRNRVFAPCSAGEGSIAGVTAYEAKNEGEYGVVLTVNSRLLPQFDFIAGFRPTNKLLHYWANKPDFSNREERRSFQRLYQSNFISNELRNVMALLDSEEIANKRGPIYNPLNTPYHVGRSGVWVR